MTHDKLVALLNVLEIDFDIVDAFEGVRVLNIYVEETDHETTEDDDE